MNLLSLQKIAWLGLCGGATLLAGCETATREQKGAATGAMIGAVAGAVLGDSTRSAALGAAAGAVGGYIWSRQMEEKRKSLEVATAGTGATVSQTADNQLRLTVPNDISFDVGRANIKPELMPILDQFARGLGQQPGVEVRIIGHTDSTGSEAVNNPLSLARAQSARDYLVARGVDGRRISTEGRGAREPIADNASEAGRARNRRIDIFLAERASG